MRCDHRTMRKLVAGLAVVGLLATAGPAALATSPTRPAHHERPVVAPYLDMGARQPGLLYRAIRHAKLHYYSGGFVIGRGCTPTWDDGEPITTDRAVTAVVAKARSLGAHVIVSFGGAAGRDLARTCTDPERLAAAYQAAVTELGASDLDFDIEGVSLARPAAIIRRFDAIKSLEAGNPRLKVSLTVPVDPNGMPTEVRKLLRTAAATPIRVDLVNIMTMDYGGGPRDMAAAAISGATGTLRQLRAIWPTAGYRNIGITPMIGRNDNVRLTFTVANARRLARFAANRHLGRLGFWAIGRDRRCGSPHRHPQDDCSSLPQSPLAFTKALVAS
jgi:hypothetical protein